MMHWSKGKCEICEFWKSDMDRTNGDIFDTRGQCLCFPEHPPTYTINKCGSFKKAGRLEIRRRARLTQRALSKDRNMPTGISEKEFKSNRNKGK